jgi:YesN/AraC family two-component response regulator
MSLLPRILIVDDEQNMRAILKDALNGQYSDLFEASNVDEAEKIYLNEKIDLIISDVYMHGKTGLDLLENVKKNCPDTHVIIITGTTLVDLAIKALEGGAVNFINKPIDIATMLEKIEKILSKISISKNDRLLSHYIKQKLEFKFPAKLDFIKGVLSQLDAALENMGYEKNLKNRHLILFALEEALKNAIIHGSLNNETKKVLLDVTLTDTAIELTITDDGKGFDHQKFLLQSKSDMMRANNGIGLLLMSCYMDELKFNAIGNSLYLKKNKFKSSFISN